MATKVTSKTDRDNYSAMLTTDMITTTDVMRLFDVTSMTVLNWRNRATDPLPCIHIPGSRRAAIRFIYRDVRAWAKRNDRVLVKTMDEVRAIG